MTEFEFVKAIKSFEEVVGETVKLTMYSDESGQLEAWDTGEVLFEFSDRLDMMSKLKPVTKPQIEGFELVEITTKDSKLVYQSPFTGMQASLVSVTSNPKFAGFVYDTYDTLVRSESRLFVTEIDSNSRTFSSSTIGDHSYMILPKWVAFIK